MLGIVALLAAACTQGPGGGGIGLASGQDPDPATVDFLMIDPQVPPLSPRLAHVHCRTGM